MELVCLVLGPGMGMEVGEGYVIRDEGCGCECEWPFWMPGVGQEDGIVRIEEIVIKFDAIY